MWNLKTAEKIKVFIWNSLHDAILVGEQFAIRNIPISSRCPRYNDIESVLHLLFTCRYAQDVWNLAPVAITFDRSIFLSTWEGLDRLRRIQSLPSSGLGPGTLSASICWNMWISRNQLVFQNRSFSPAETILKAISEAREWSASQEPLLQSKTPISRINQDPILDPNRTCMFTHAAWNPSTKDAGLAWIIDDAGSTSTHSATSSYVASPLIAETWVLRNAMISSLQCGINALSIFSNSQVLVNLVNFTRKTSWDRCSSSRHLSSLFSFYYC